MSPRGHYKPIWLDREQLEEATSVEAVKACCNDDSIGGPANQSIVLRVIRRAEARTLSWLAEFGPPPFDAATLQQLAGDELLASAALEYAVAYMFDRHPEYARSVRNEDPAARVKSADTQMERILEARQRPPTVAKKAANVGGVNVDNANRLVTDSPNGTSNAGDY